MRRIFLGLLLIATYFTYAQNNTVYIDPTYSGTETGTINQPFNSWSDVSFNSNTTYLQKRGTTIQGCFIVNNKTNVTIGAYGSGENPVITGIPGSSTSIVTFARAKNYIIEDINFVGHHSNAPVAGVYVYGDWDPTSTTTSENITIRNCEVSYCYNGFRFLPLNTDVDKILIENCVIHDIYEDGIFIDGVSESICRDLYIYRVNLDWYFGPHTQANAPGDGIQYTGDSDNFLIERCIIDRRDTGLKFCFIHSDNAGGAFKNDGIIRDCLFYPPKDSTGAESAGGAFFIGGGDSLIIERCIVYGRDRIYSKPGDGDNGGPIGQFSFDYITFHHCLFDSVAIIQTTMLNDVLNFNNNTFATNASGTPLMLTGGTTYIKNSIFVLGPNTGHNFGVGSVDNSIVYQGHISTWDANLGFIDSENGDFHLSSSSIAVNGGLDLGYLYDLDSVLVPQGNAPDLGCYEYIDGSGQAPVPQFYANDTIIAYGGTVEFHDISTNNPDERVWIFSGGIPGISNKVNPTVQYLTSGFHNVLLIVSNEYGSNSLTKHQYIEVLPPVINNPIAGFSATDSVIFVGENVHFTDQSQNNPTSWLWVFEGGTPFFSTAKNPNITYNYPGVFNVKLFASNVSGSDTLIKNDFITVYNDDIPPVSNFSVSDNVVSIGESISFIDESTNIPDSWTWIFQQGTPSVSNLQNPNITFNSIGNFYVALITENPFGTDIEIKSNYITVYDPSLPLVADFSSEKSIDFVGSPVNFHDLTFNGAISWNWNFGGILTSTSKNPSVVFNSPGIYDVTLTVTSEVSTNSITKTDYVEILPIDQFVKYEDDFNDGSIFPAWDFFKGNWNENNGIMRQYSYYYDNGLLNGSFAVIGSPNWHDYILSCNFKSTNNNGIGLVFNYMDDENMYMFFWRNTSNERKLIRWQNGVSSVLAEDNIPYTSNLWYNAEIFNMNGEISVKINGTEIFNATDNTLNSGKAGLYCLANNGSYFDNFKVRSCVTDIDLKAFLEGAFEANSMTTMLNSQELLPLSHPFTGSPWYYNGDESVSSIPNANVTDWVLIEIRDAVNASSALPSTIISKQAAFILNNGSIVGLDGSSKLRLDADPENQLFAVVRHRNHLAVMSAIPLNYSAGTYYYNFTSSSNQAYGTNAQKNLGYGKYGLYGGDFNGNGSINTFDKHFVWAVNVGKCGYLKADGNFDCRIDNLDKNDVWYNNTVKMSQVPKSNLIDKVYNTNIQYD